MVLVNAAAPGVHEVHLVTAHHLAVIDSYSSLVLGRLTGARSRGLAKEGPHFGINCWCVQTGTHEEPEGGKHCRRLRGSIRSVRQQIALENTLGADCCVAIPSVEASRNQGP